MEMYDYEREHLKVLRDYLGECTVLLKSDGSFPLDSPCRIAAYGSGVRHTVKGGTGSGEVNSRYFINVENGLKKAGFELTTTQWLNAYDRIRSDAKKDHLKQLKAEAKAAGLNVMIYGMGRVMPEPEYSLPLDAEGDAAIYVLARVSGEGSDRLPVKGDIMLSDAEKRDICELNRRFGKFMLVLNVGGVVDLSEVREVKNILLLSQLGVETGAVLADILLGKTGPSGKLTTTWASWEDYAKIGDFGDRNDTHYREGVYVGYRYFNAAGKKPLYPFGFGLSYARFGQTVETVTLDGSAVTAQVSVSNVGSHPGKEILQLYLCPPQGRLSKPYQSLAAFGKTETLAEGQAEQLTISFDMRDQSSYDENQAAYILEKGDYILRIGNSSENTVPAAIIRVSEECVVRRVRKALDAPENADWSPLPQCRESVSETLPILVMGDIETECIDYRDKTVIDEAVKKLSNEELACLNVGAFDPKGGIFSVIGYASRNVAGAAGETTSALTGKGFIPLVMADGPAGLRLSQKFYRDGKGTHSIGGSAIPESVTELMPAPVRWLSGLLGGRKTAPGKVQIEYQYCTAIPIGTALAQSWNLKFARLCGDLVGDEMELFGVSLWLAPALNIQRSILCGRNFEYYSEDPVVSGLFSAAITKGVQTRSNRGVTIKHYAANNQEYNRYGSNSLVSERAMREIYLRGFEICIRESHPQAVMSSYNLLNGTHTAERRDLCQDILRSEFGFTGVLMTDWIVGSMMRSKKDKHAPVRPARIAAAGGDLIMPGSKKDYLQILQALHDGTLSREQLERNATHVFRLSKSLQS